MLNYEKISKININNKKKIYIYRIYVICDTQIYSFTLQGFQSVDIIETYDNRLGVFGICYDPNVTIIAFPDKAKKGKVRIKNMDKNSTNTVDAHENIISFISFNNNGSIMATASDRGTLIRLFLTETGYFFQEIRRGKDKAVIKDICFEPNNKLIACCSDKGTVHIWNLESKLKQVFKDENENNNKEEGISSSSKKEDLAQNHKSIFSSLPNFVSGGFFKSEWSFANVRIKDSNSICCFGKEDEIIIISSQGNYYKANIDLKKGGDCEITEKIEYAK
jgi:WD40 repeat protein